MMVPVTSREVKDVIFFMHPDTSPGIDGLKYSIFSNILEYSGE